MKFFGKFLWVLWVLFVLYSSYCFLVKAAIDNWVTNAESKAVAMTPKEEEIYQLPDDVINAKCVQFILKGIEKRKTFNEAVKTTSKELWVNYNIVISAILWEQIRISCKWVRWSLKSIIMSSTPTLFRSHNVSVGVAWIKLNTALQIKKDAIKYWYGDGIKNIAVSEDILTYCDKTSWIYATYLVKNIVHRRFQAGHDISMNAWIVWTLYNLWNNIKKEPHANPKVWWSIIEIAWKKFCYWEISLWVYNYLNENKGNSK